MVQGASGTGGLHKTPKLVVCENKNLPKCDAILGSTCLHWMSSSAKERVDIFQAIATFTVTTSSSDDVRDHVPTARWGRFRKTYSDALPYGNVAIEWALRNVTTGRVSFRESVFTYRQGRNWMADQPRGLFISFVSQSQTVPFRHIR